MRSAQLLSFGMIGVLLTVLASDAPAAGVLNKKLLLLPKPRPRAVAHYVPPKPAYVRPPVVAFVRPVPRYVYHAPLAAVPVQHAALTAPPPPSAPLDPSKPQLLALNGDWSVFRAITDGGRTCYSATQPKDSAPRQAAREPVYFYLTNTTPGSVKHELTFKLGFAMAAGTVIANVDGRDFQLAASSGIAYPPDEHIQKDLLQAMRRGHTLLLKTSLGGGSVTDSFSLLGIDESLRATDQACAEVSARN